VLVLGVTKIPGNRLATLALLGKMQTPDKTISGGLKPQKRQI